MTQTEKELEVRARVKELRRFYSDLTLYVAINVGLILIWAISGGGYFWPIWVIVGWGIGIAMRALSLGIVPALSSIFPFFTEEWEEQQVKRMLGEKGEPAGSEAPKKQKEKA